MPYITYLTDLSQSNSYSSHPGWGETKEESVKCSLYWANQLPWVKTVPASKAPKWARLAARTPRWIELDCRTKVGPALTRAEEAELQSYHDAEIYG